MKRHYLVGVSKQGRERSFAHYCKHYGSALPEEQAEQLICGYFDSVQLPGIVRREERNPVAGMVPIGFVSPYLQNGRRMRLPAFVYPDDIVEISSPYDLVERAFNSRTSSLKLLGGLRHIARQSGITLGVWGSASLEIYTSLQYTHPQSDLDLLVAMSDVQNLKKFFTVAMGFSRQYDCRIDMEIDLAGGFGVQAAEFLSDTDCVLGKGIDEVVFLSKATILEHYRCQ